MASLEEIFYKEFNQMMQQLKANTPQINLVDVPIPNELVVDNEMAKYEQVVLLDIKDEYYSKLNDSINILWKHGVLVRRKFDYKGEFIKDKNDEYVTEQVTLPHSCIAIISDTSIGVPNKYKCDEPFQYIDVISKIDDKGNRINKYIYIVPRQYCYKINQTALVLSWTRLRTFYTGVQIALTNGNNIFLHVIPYKPTSVIKNYRVLMTKATDDYVKEIAILKDAWVKNGIMFNPELCIMMDGVKGRENLAYLMLDTMLDTYYAYDTSKNIGDNSETADELDIF